MAANNSCGSRSIRYGLMRDNVAAIDALLADGTKAVFGEVRRDAGTGLYENNAVAALFQDLLDLGGREAAEIRARFPQVLRRVGGYNLDALAPNGPTNNLTHLLVGSEGTRATIMRITLQLLPILANRALGGCQIGRAQV